MDLFFVLSGFLVACLLLQEKDSTGGISLSRFYGRRILRLVPVLVVFLAGYWVLCLVVFKDFQPRLLQSTVAALLFLTNVWMGWFGKVSILAHTWALALEGQFYVTVPPLLKWGSRWFSLIAAAGVCLVPLWRFFLLQCEGFGGPEYRYVYSLDTRFDTFLWGCITAVVLRQDNRWQKTVVEWAGRPCVPLLGLLVVWLSVVLSLGCRWFEVTVGYTLTALGFSIVVASIVADPQRRTAKILSKGSLVWIGVLSYSLYLWHPAALGLAFRAANHVPFEAAKAVTHGSFVLLSFSAACMSYYLVERRFTRWRRKLAVCDRTAGLPG